MARSIPQTVASYTELVQNAIVHHTGGDNGGQWDPSRYLDRWIPLPLLGGTFIKLQRSSGCCQLVMFPRLSRLELELHFKSEWLGEETILKEVDGLKICPAKCIWSYCQWCRKFHLPYDGPRSHRSGGKHKKFREMYDAALRANPDMEAVEALRILCSAWSPDMWL